VQRLRVTRTVVSSTVRGGEQPVLCLLLFFCRYLPVSFNQAIGSTTPFFTAVIAFFMQVCVQPGAAVFHSLQTPRVSPFPCCCSITCASTFLHSMLPLRRHSA
jgi:hypothetical protein